MHACTILQFTCAQVPTTTCTFLLLQWVLLLAPHIPRSPVASGWCNSTVTYVGIDTCSQYNVIIFWPAFSTSMSLQICSFSGGGLSRSSTAGYIYHVLSSMFVCMYTCHYLFAGCLLSKTMFLCLVLSIDHPYLPLILSQP